MNFEYINHNCITINLKRNKIMPSTRYEIYVKGMLCFVKYSQQEFNRVCLDMKKLNISYKVKIIDLI